MVPHTPPIKSQALPPVVLRQGGTEPQTHPYPLLSWGLGKCLEALTVTLGCLVGKGCKVCAVQLGRGQHPITVLAKMPIAPPLRNPGREITKEVVASLLRK